MKSRAAPQQIWEDVFISMRLIHFAEPLIQRDPRIAPAVSQHGAEVLSSSSSGGNRLMKLKSCNFRRVINQEIYVILVFWVLVCVKHLGRVIRVI